MTATGTTGAHHTDPDDALDAQLAQLEDQLVTRYVGHGQHDEAEVRPKSSVPLDSSPAPGFVAFCRS